MPTVYRRLLNVLPRLGFTVTDLGPGAAVVSRARRQVHPLSDRLQLLARARTPVTVEQLDDDAWIVSTRRGAPLAPTRLDDSSWIVGTDRKDPFTAFAASLRASLPRARWTAVPLRSTGAQIVAPREALTKHERTFQLAAADHLCSVHVAAMLRYYDVNCVFDVGANVGQYAKALRRQGYKGRIASFEPVTATFERLSAAAESDPQWHVFNFALGEEESVQSISVDWKSMNSLLPPSEYGQSRYLRFAESRTEEIQVRRLDGVMDKVLDGIDDPRPYLKMDTQGFDLHVFRGAGDRVPEFVGLQSEVAPLRLYEGSPAMRDSLALFEDAGFGVTGMYPVTREPATGRVVEFDCVMMRATAAPDTPMA
ncbi:FkbM family methyltransferase [Streptomyces sp. NPDC060194]|uniref:FkbM family methyltransferase n=1 Tax=Streptomyces sp. NPDC060194 TaxID=3347069 RepID=UPI0036526FEC